VVARIVIAWRITDSQERPRIPWGSELKTVSAVAGHPTMQMTSTTIAAFLLVRGLTMTTCSRRQVALLDLPAQSIEARLARCEERVLGQIDLRLWIQDVLDDLVEVALDLLDLLASNPQSVLRLVVGGVGEERSDLSVLLVGEAVDDLAADEGVIDQLEAACGPGSDDGGVKS